MGPPSLLQLIGANMEKLTAALSKNFQCQFFFAVAHVTGSQQQI